MGSSNPPDGPRPECLFRFLLRTRHNLTCRHCIGHARTKDPTVSVVRGWSCGHSDGPSAECFIFIIPDSLAIFIAIGG